MFVTVTLIHCFSRVRLLHKRLLHKPGPFTTSLPVNRKQSSTVVLLKEHNAESQEILNQNVPLSTADQEAEPLPPDQQSGSSSRNKSPWEDAKNGAVPLQSVLDPTLIEKMRLETPSEHCVMISTINNHKFGQNLADRVEQLQERAPFPKLKPYYLTRKLTTNDNEIADTDSDKNGVRREREE